MNRLAVIWTLLRMQWKSLFLQKRILFILGVLFIPVMLTLIGQSNGINRENFLWYLVMYYVLYGFTLPVFLSILYNGSIIHSEVESQTLTYLFTRPQPRWVILTGLYCGLTASLITAMSLSIILNWLVSGSVGGVYYLITIMHISCLALIVYGALFFMIGVLFPNRSTVTGIIYAIVIEGLVSFIPAVIGKVTISYHLRLLYFKILEGEDKQKVFEWLGIDFSEYSGPKIWLTMLFISLVLLFITSIVVSNREFNKDRPAQ